MTAYNPDTTRYADGNIRDAATYRILIRAPEAGAERRLETTPKKLSMLTQSGIVFPMRETDS